jgi:hypothetical protein
MFHDVPTFDNFFIPSNKLKSLIRCLLDISFRSSIVDKIKQWSKLLPKSIQYYFFLKRC